MFKDDLESSESEILPEQTEHKESDQQTFSLVEYDFFSKIKEKTLSWFGANSDEKEDFKGDNEVTGEV